MFLTKLKTAAALLLAVAVTGAGAGVLSYRTLAADPTGAQHAAADTVDRADPPPADKPVAYIYGDVPVTRAEFGEYLIARHRDQLQQLVNRRIIEHACRERDIAVSAAEVDAALAEDLKGMGNLSVQDFVDQWLKRYHKCLFEWKADIIRPRLLLTKLVRGRVRVTEADVRAAYEAAYGEKVECRMILWPTKSRAAARRSYDDLRASADAFERAAHQQATPALAKTGGLVTIARHGTERPELERAAFRLRPGEFGPLIETPDGFVALQCVRRVAPDPNVTLNDVRDALAAQVRSRKTQQEIATVFRELEQEARPRLLLRPQ